MFTKLSMFGLIITLVVTLNGLCILGMLAQLKNEKQFHINKIETFKLSISGIIAFMADTIGVGSFATNIALAKTFKTFPDEQLPAMVNGAQIIPGVLESIFFMQMFEVDKVTLFTLVLGTCIGGLLGGKIVCRLSKQTIRLTMLTCFSLIILLLVSNELRILPVGGNLTELHDYSLLLGFIGMMICGALTSAGIGLFALVQAVLFLLQVSPAVAFPIMMTAGAMQQPLTTLIFLKERKIPIKKTLIVSLAGCVGVLMITPIFKWFSATTLHFMLVAVLIYNIINIGRAYFSSKKQFKLVATESC
jgi:uncharacterized membrane protein YfcA